MESVLTILDIGSARLCEMDFDIQMPTTAFIAKELRSDVPFAPNASYRCVFWDHVKHHGLRDALTCWCYEYAKKELAFDRK